MFVILLFIIQIAILIYFFKTKLNLEKKLTDLNSLLQAEENFCKCVSEFKKPESDPEIPSTIQQIVEEEIKTETTNVIDSEGNIKIPTIPTKKKKSKK